MSVSIVLLPLAIALVSTVGSGVTVVSMIREKSEQRHAARQELPPMPTQFTSLTLLEKTLTEHGLGTKTLSENELVCATGKATLTYRRGAKNESFYVTVSGLENPDELIEELECLDAEYKQNVQSYTYGKLMNGLSYHNMTLQSETVLEDNSILLTIDV